MTVTFNGERLRVLRHYHGHTQRGLAELVGTTPSSIANYENGRRPQEIALKALAFVLRVEPEFFFEPDVDEFQDSQTNFRSRVTTTDRERKKILAHATLFGSLMQYLGTYIAWPTLRLPRIAVTTTDEIEAAAERCRIELSVGIDAPIQNVAHMAELAGVVLTTLDSPASKKIDAFSRYGGTNIVVLNPARNNVARTRFDIGHEICHGVAHRDMPADQEIGRREEQAEHFAGALLMPRGAFAREFWNLGRSPSWPQLIGLKERWGAHLPAIVVRAYQLGLIDAAEYGRRFKYMAKAGWLRVGGSEPGSIPEERPQLFWLAFRRYQAETGKDSATIAADLKWSVGLFTSITGEEPPPADLGPNVRSFEAFRQRKLASG